MTIFSVVYFVRNMLSIKNKFTYEEAVLKLNMLQSKKATGCERISKGFPVVPKRTKLENMENYLSRTGITLSMLDQLSVIHVTGTKGKGSTCAMCESILRTHGFRTGFYSSPHLVAVRERIRLGGRALTESQFAESFHQVYDALYETQTFEGDMPRYFAFLTILAFKVFLKEKVDVAIVEVGIGGVVDCTNILRKVSVVGITSLGLDHTSVLGDTLPQIAAAKAGIMKSGCEAFTVQQPPEAMAVLRTVASNLQCPLFTVPDYGTYAFENGYNLTMELDAYKINASLAIQLSHAWMRKTQRNKNNFNGNDERNDKTSGSNDDNENILVNNLCNETVMGIKEFQWPGRYQIIRIGDTKFFLDGAHTKESMALCANWFERNNRKSTKILIFSATGYRDTSILLNILADINFEDAYFVIPTAYNNTTINNDNYSPKEYEDLLLKCENMAVVWKQSNRGSKVTTLECVSDVLQCIKNKPNISVLVTGSLHLVGAVLSIIHPNVSENV